MHFYYLTEDFGMVDVCVFERKTQFEVKCLDIILICLKLHTEILIYIFLVFNRCYFQTREWCQIPAIPTSLLGHQLLASLCP